jgi:hypothetical protein
MIFKEACIRCMENTVFLQLGKNSGSSKTVYMGHQRWLTRLAHGESVEIYSMVQMSPEDVHVRRVAKRSIHY